MVNIKDKKQAIKTLLEFSMLFFPAQKEAILKSLGNLSDAEIDGLGKILSVEHQYRDELDQDMLEKVLKNLADKGIV